MSDPATWVLTGMSGAGKATALSALEQAGAQCMDNLAPGLVPAIAMDGRTTVAVVDARQGRLLEGWSPPEGARVLFLDATDDTLRRRLGDSRRPHPCAAAGNVPAQIVAERELLTALRAAADVVVDTSNLTAEELGERIIGEVAPSNGNDPATLHLTVSSFGFKFGSVTDADWVFDARVLPNPFWVPELRPQTGRDAAVIEYLQASEEARAYLSRCEALLDWVATAAQGKHRGSMHVAVGCTGGRHRSVWVAEALARRLAGPHRRVTVRHRDVERADPR